MKPMVSGPNLYVVDKIVCVYFFFFVVVFHRLSFWFTFRTLTCLEHYQIRTNRWYKFLHLSSALPKIRGGLSSTN